MAIILGGGMPQPYGAYDPGSGSPRMDLLFRGILERMQGIKDKEAAEREQERVRDIEERKLRVGERGIELRESEAKREELPLVLPPDMVSQVTKHFKITPESFQGLEKNIQISMVGEMIREAGREGERAYGDAKDREKIAALEAKESEAQTERDRVGLLGKHYRKLDLARKRVEEIREGIKEKFAPRIVAGRVVESNVGKRQEALRVLEAYFSHLAMMDSKLTQEEPLNDADLKILDELISHTRETIQEDKLVSIQTGGEEHKIGETKIALSGKYKGMRVVYVGDGRWKRK